MKSHISEKEALLASIFNRKICISNIYFSSETESNAVVCSCSPEGSCILSCVTSGMTVSSDCPPLLLSSKTLSAVFIQTWFPQRKKDSKLLERIQRRKINKGLEHSPMKKVWRSWACLDWKREGCGDTSLRLSRTWRELTKEAVPPFYTVWQW